MYLELWWWQFSSADDGLLGLLVSHPVFSMFSWQRRSFPFMTWSSPSKRGHKTVGPIGCWRKVSFYVGLSVHQDLCLKYMQQTYCKDIYVYLNATHWTFNFCPSLIVPFQARDKTLVHSHKPSLNLNWGLTGRTACVFTLSAFLP